MVFTEPAERLLAWRAQTSQRTRYAHWSEDPRQALGLRAIADVIERLRERGHFGTRTGHNDSFDLLVSGLRVEVKAATWSARWRRYQANPRSNEADVLILGCQSGRMHWFVIPFEQVRGLRNIAICSAEPERYCGRWRAYLEGWGLIEELIGRGVNHCQRRLVTADGKSWADGDADCGI